MGRQRLADKVTSILHRIERDLDQVDSRIGEAMHVLDIDNDGLVCMHHLPFPIFLLQNSQMSEWVGE